MATDPRTLPIQELGLRPYIAPALHALDIQTVGDLTKFSVDDFPAIHGVGSKGLRTIVLALASYGLHLRPAARESIVRAIPPLSSLRSQLMPRPANLAKLSVTDLHKELKRRQRGGQSLLRKRAKLAAKLDVIDAQIAELGMQGSKGGSVLPGGAKRHKNEMSLVDALAVALKGKTMGVAEAAEAVQKAGYKTTAANFRTMVNIALINSGKFKRVERGQYTVKG